MEPAGCRDPALGLSLTGPAAGSLSPHWPVPSLGYGPSSPASSSLCAWATLSPAQGPRVPRGHPAPLPLPLSILWVPVAPGVPDAPANQGEMTQGSPGVLSRGGWPVSAWRGRVGRGLGVQALGVPPGSGQEKAEWAAPGPPAGRVPLSFRGAHSSASPTHSGSAPLRAGGGTGQEAPLTGRPCWPAFPQRPGTPSCPCKSRRDGEGPIRGAGGPCSSQPVAGPP